MRLTPSASIVSSPSCGAWSLLIRSSDMPDLTLARKVLQTEAAAILALEHRIDENFARAVTLIRNCRGRVIVTGMGKSGIICRKIAATLASTGTPAFFLHPAEAVHGDLGVIQADDVVITMSYSGETEELTRVLETLKRSRQPCISLAAASKGTRAHSGDAGRDCSEPEEACPMNLVPAASPAAAGAMRGALARSGEREKGFKPEDFANLHP